MSPFSSFGFRRSTSPLASLRGSSGKSNPLLQGDEPFTLMENLRTRPLPFVTACAGLLGILALKLIFTRAEGPSKPGRR